MRECQRGVAQQLMLKREAERERVRERPNNTIQRRKRKIKQMVREEERESIGSVK